MEIIKQRKIIKSCIRGNKIFNEKILFQSSDVEYHFVDREYALENDIRTFIYDFSKGKRGDLLIENVPVFEIDQAKYGSIVKNYSQVLINFTANGLNDDNARQYLKWDGKYNKVWESLWI